ncbi:MAG: phosphate acyltransferase PlsX [Candidatus Hydrogenedentes bacterium]|nr:phosphate acyltransferase PlsX [Candidatus Hydrogenedentota bacterium]
MRVAVDAMGSDGAPEVEVEGAVQASLEGDTEIVLVGDEAQLKPKLEAFPKHGNIRIVHASEAVAMHESPVNAIRQKKDSSLLVALRLVKEGEADAFVSAGNTGAVMVGARTVLGPIRGVARSAICQALPTRTGKVVVLDLGANVDCSARRLCEFAEMGIAYSHYALGVENPRVGLLNIGEEDVKGTQVAKEVHGNLKDSPHMNFIGNVEPRAMYNGEADVIICDGFIGNLMLKTSEAVAWFMAQLMREKLESSSMSKLGAVLARKSLQELKNTIDPNEIPGAPLLGVNGVVIIIHGSSSPRGVANGIVGARVNFENRLIEHIKENIEELRAVERAMTGTAVGNGGQ